MITITQSRQEDGENSPQKTLAFDDWLKALAHLAQTELAWGAKVTKVNRYCIVVETEVFNYLDTAIFRGSEEDMKPLLELVRSHMEVVKLSTPDSPIMRKNQVKIAVMFSFGVRDEGDIKTGLGAEIEDIVTAAQRSRENGCSFSEALAL